MSGQDWAVWEQVSLSRRARSKHSPVGVKVTMSGQDWAVWEQVSLSRRASRHSPGGVKVTSVWPGLGGMGAGQPVQARQVQALTYQGKSDNFWPGLGGMGAGEPV
jgi:hypothetical protein